MRELVTSSGCKKLGKHAQKKVFQF